ncbi:MAG: MobC family plasmid mobilization relaxosome protein [Oscillospiraceae bacterium]|nr:MobC family plasmid mobilization relaxosome protein [Oscillospiraceae bacterium]
MPYPKYKKQLHIAFNPEDWEIILKKSEKAEMKPSAYITKIALNGMIKHYDTMPFNKLMIAINRYGNNLSQIAKVANTYGSIFENDIKDIQSDMQHIKELAYDCFSEMQFINADD